MPRDPRTGEQLSTRDYNFRTQARSNIGSEVGPLDAFLESIHPDGIREMIKILQRKDIKGPVRKYIEQDLEGRQAAFRGLESLGEGSYNPGSFRRVDAPPEEGPLPSDDVSRYHGPRGVPSRFRKPVDTLSKPFNDFLSSMDSNIPLETDSFEEKASKILQSMNLGGIGMLAGRKAAERLGGEIYKRFDAAEQAQQRGSSGYNIWSRFRAEPGIDKKMRFEIPDAAAELKGRIDPNTVEMGSLQAFLHHPELLKAYPELGRIHVEMRKLPNSIDAASGKYNSSARLITARAGTDDELLQVLLHELQHGVQKIEGFPRGTNPRDVLSKTYPTQESPQLLDRLKELRYISPQMRAYGRTAGEVEARNVPYRFANPDMQNFAPSLTEDIQRGWQIGY